MATPSGKPNSVFSGVRVGCITYSYRGAINSAQDTLKALIQDGLSEVELMGGPIQAFAGIGKEAQPGKPTDTEREAQLVKCRELRKMYNDAGVTIHIHKMDFGPPDEAIDFSFQVAKALGSGLGHPSSVGRGAGVLLHFPILPLADRSRPAARVSPAPPQ